MSLPLRDALRAVSPHLPLELVSREALLRLEQIADRVAQTQSTFGFECRLGPGADEVDLGLAVATHGGGPASLARAAPSAEAAGAGDAWERIRRFARRWGEPDSDLQAWVPFVFLEYDADSAREATPVPSVFVGLDSPLQRSGRASDPAHWPELAALRESAALLTGHPLPPALDARVPACFGSLPEHGRVLHLGVMLGRRARGVRLSVLAPPTELGPYLEDVGGSELLRAAIPLFEWLDHAPGWAQLDFALEPEPGSRVGFTLRPGDLAHWRELLDALCTGGVACPTKAEALCTWVAPIREAPGTALERYLSHVKLSLGPNRLPVAKAYFGASPPRRAPAGP